MMLRRLKASFVFGAETDFKASVKSISDAAEQGKRMPFVVCILNTRND